MTAQPATTTSLPSSTAVRGSRVDHESSSHPVDKLNSGGQNNHPDSQLPEQSHRHDYQLPEQSHHHDYQPPAQWVGTADLNLERDGFEPCAPKKPHLYIAGDWDDLVASLAGSPAYTSYPLPFDGYRDPKPVGYVVTSTPVDNSDAAAGTGAAGLPTQHGQQISGSHSYHDQHQISGRSNYYEEHQISGRPILYVAHQISGNQNHHDTQIIGRPDYHDHQISDRPNFHDEHQIGGNQNHPDHQVSCIRNYHHPPLPLAPSQRDLFEWSSRTEEDEQEERSRVERLNRKKEEEEEVEEKVWKKEAVNRSPQRLNVESLVPEGLWIDPSKLTFGYF